MARDKILKQVLKFLKDNKVSSSIENDMVTFSIYFDELKYSLYPYISIDEENEEISFVINVKKIDNIDLNLLKRINTFNTKSKYLCAKIINMEVLVLEYNIICKASDIEMSLKEVIKNVFALAKDIDLL